MDYSLDKLNKLKIALAPGNFGSGERGERGKRVIQETCYLCLAMKKTTLSAEVTTFLNTIDHPLRREIDVLRRTILDASPGLAENVKWNGPNYTFGQQDRVTMKIHPPTMLQLIFHRGAKVMAQPETRLIEDPAGLLVWKGNDRAVASFKSLAEINQARPALDQIVADWLAATRSGH